MDKIQELIKELLSGDDARAEAAVKALSASGPEALPVLQPLLSAPEADTRWWATWALAELRDSSISKLLIERLNDPEMTVRQCAALALRQHPDSQAIPALIESLQSGDTALAHLAGAALTVLGEQASPALVEVLENGSQAARLEALRALAQIADKSTIPALMAAFQADSALMEYWANEGLDRMGLGMNYFKT